MILVYYCLALLIGILSGVVTYVFGVLLNNISGFTVSMVDQGVVLLPIVLLPVVGFVTIFLRNMFKSEVYRSMPKIFAATKSGDQLSFLILPFQFITTCLSHLAGASVGREGAAVQLGATLANAITSFFPSVDRRSMTRLGMAAGFAGLFGTPLAATVFSCETTKKRSVQFIKITSTLIATITSSKVAESLGLSRFHAETEFEMLDSKQFILFIICVLVFAVVGHLFAYVYMRLRRFYLGIQVGEYKRIIIFSIIGGILLMAVHDGRYMSFGTNIMTDVFENPNNVYYLDFLFKALFTLYFCCLGFQGGEVTPLFAIGSSLGLVLAYIMGLPLAMVAGIGCAFTFGNATNAYFTAAILAIELFGIAIAPYALLALIITKIIGNDIHTIYPNLEWE